MYDMHLGMEIKGFYCNSWPKLTIKQNNKILYEEFIVNSHIVDMQIENKSFTIGMENKSFGKDNVWDTLVDNNGTITADKYLVIKNISLDDVNFENNLRKIPYQSTEHGPTIIHDQTIRFNGYWQIDTKDNPYNWIIDLANKRESENRTVSYFSDYQSHSNYDDHHKVIAEIREMI
tara:strand:- start:1535 stop:2062 length:528 start_codon:yes stop_codon:yes gene_type:complete